MRAAKSGREDMRRDHGHQRIGPGNACPCSNEREHIRIAVDDPLPTASKKRPAAPEHYGCRKRKLEPVKHAMRSEEHTSELQSLMRISYAVFRWKKKTHIKSENLSLHYLS